MVLPPAGPNAGPGVSMGDIQLCRRGWALEMKSFSHFTQIKDAVQAEWKLCATPSQGPEFQTEYDTVFWPCRLLWSCSSQRKCLHHVAGAESGIITAITSAQNKVEILAGSSPALRLCHTSSWSSCSSFLKAMESLRAALQHQNMLRKCQCDDFVGFQDEIQRPHSILWNPNHISFYKPYHVPEGHHICFWSRKLLRNLSWCFGTLLQQMPTFLWHRRVVLCTVKINYEKWQVKAGCFRDGKHRITAVVTALRLYYPQALPSCVCFAPFDCRLFLLPPFIVLCAAHNVAPTSCILLQQWKKTSALTFFHLPCKFTGIR